MRVAAAIEYDGSAFWGWQSQANGRTVQATVETAFSQVAAHEVEVVCAGRTDAGVHAIGQVVHFDTAAGREEHSWLLGANSNLPPDVCVRWVRLVDDDFHARYSARSRSYRYLILNRSVRSALLARRATWYRRPLDAGLMEEGARHLLGEHDFSSFRAVACQARHAMRCVREIAVARHGEMIVVDVTANAFLHHMVRNIVGVLMEVGCGDRDPAWVRAVLDCRDRTQAGITAPADGLYLAAVGYDACWGLPQPEGVRELLLTPR